MSDSSTTADQTILALDAPNLPLAIRYPVDADFGVPKDIYDLAGCAVIVQPYLGQQPGDTVSITVNGAPDVDRRQTQSDSDAVTLTIPPQELLSGRFNYLTYSVTRNSQNLGTYEPPLKLLYNSIRPGNQDLTPGDNAHSELVLVLPDEIKNGVGPGFTQATVCVEYPYCRAYDRIRLNCNGRDLDYTVTATQAPPPPNHGSATPTRVCFVVTSADLGDDDPEFSFSFTVNDQLNNTPDEDARWSAVQVVDVDKAGARLPVPIPREDTSDNSDDPSIIDRDNLAAGGPLSLIILTSDSRFRVGDTIEATYTTKVAGQPDVVYIVSGIVAGDFGQTVPCVLQIPNEQVVSGSTAHMAYRLLRDNVLVGTSRTAVATVIGLGEPDEKPVITGAQDSNGAVIPDGGTTTDTTVTLTGTALKDGQVDIFRNGVFLATADVNGAGTWTYTATGLLPGLLSFTAVAKYGGEQTSLPWSLTVTAQDVPVAFTSVRGTSGQVIANGETTTERTVSLHGRAAANSDVELYDGTTFIGKVPVSSQGEWVRDQYSVNVGQHDFIAEYPNGAVQAEYMIRVREKISLSWNFNDGTLQGWEPVGPYAGPNECVVENGAIRCITLVTGVSYRSIVIQRRVQLTAGTKYACSFKVRSYNGLSPAANIQMRIRLHEAFGSSPFGQSVQTTSKDWVTGTGTFEAIATINSYLEIYNHTPDGYFYNDFWLDDITFREE